MPELSDATKAMLAEQERFARLAGDELTVYAEGLCYASVCTSLPDEQADAMMANRPSGTRNGWQRSKDTHFHGGLPNPCPCERDPDTRRHILYEA
jgi:hypothetical protein